MKSKAGKKKTGKSEKQKLKSIGIDLPREIGRVVYVTKYPPYLLKKILFLKSFYVVIFIAVIVLVSLMVYHLCTMPDWTVKALLGILSLYVFAIVTFEDVFFRDTVIKAVGMYGFIVYGIRFNAKSIKKNVVFYKDIENLRYNVSVLNRRNISYYTYTLIQKNNAEFSMTIDSFNRTNDELNFMIHVLKNWIHTASYLPHDKTYHLIDGLERMKY